MKFPIVLIVMVVAAVSFFVMMHVKTDVQTLSQEQSGLLADQQLLKEDLRVLKAEYAHLSRPDRLWQLADSMSMGESQTYQLAGAPVSPELLDFVRNVNMQ